MLYEYVYHTVEACIIVIVPHPPADQFACFSMIQAGSRLYILSLHVIVTVVTAAVPFNGIALLLLCPLMQLQNFAFLLERSICNVVLEAADWSDYSQVCGRLL